MNTVTQTFNFPQTQSWTCPAGVFTVTAQTKKAPFWARQGMDNFIYGYGSYESPCVITPNGVAYMWGFNVFGQLGIGNVTPQSSPVAVLGGLQFAKIQGGFEVLGLTTSGKLYSWGNNVNGQLGIGSVIAQSSPVAVLAGVQFQDIFYNEQAGFFAIALDGTTYAWGANLNGCLGVGGVTPVSTPTVVLGGLKFARIYCGGYSPPATYGITNTGALYAWGSNADGQLGIGNVTPQSSPVAVLGGLSFRYVSADGLKVLALTNAGAAYAWGFNANGELGVGSVLPKSSPVAVLGGLTFASVYANNFSVVSASCFGLTSAGVLYAWGRQSSGELGIGNVTPQSSPVAVLGGLTFAKFLSTGNQSSFALTSAGVLYAWGRNDFGQLGIGSVITQSSPVAVLGGLTFQDLVASNSVLAPMGLTAGNNLYSWGNGPNGELGNGTTTPQSSPVLVLGNLGVAQAPQITNTILSVVPGTTYTITLGQMNPMFGTVVLAQGPVDSVTLKYDQ